MTEAIHPESSMILYQTEGGQTRIQCRFELVRITNKFESTLFSKISLKWTLKSAQYLVPPLNLSSARDSDHRFRPKIFSNLFGYIKQMIYHPVSNPSQKHKL